jgi:hypothetical protein
VIRSRNHNWPAPESLKKRFAGHRSSLTSLPPFVVTGGCDVLAFQHWYAAGSVQFHSRCTCLELCCTACPGVDNKYSCIVLSPQWQTPLHGGNVRHGGRRSTCVPYNSFSMPLPFAGSHDHCCGRSRGVTDHCVLLCIRDSCRQNRFPHSGFWLSLKNYRTWSSFRVSPYLGFVHILD